MASSRSGRGQGRSRSRIPRDPSRWTPKERELVRQYLREHPYDATWAGFRSGGEPKREVRRNAYEQSMDNLRRKFETLQLKRDAGLLSQREYDKQRTALNNILNHLWRAHRPKPARQPGESLESFVKREKRWKTQQEESQKFLSREYNKLRMTGGKVLPEEKRLIMTKEEREKWKYNRYDRDRFWEIFYHSYM